MRGGGCRAGAGPFCCVAEVIKRVKGNRHFECCCVFFSLCLLFSRGGVSLRGNGEIKKSRGGGGTRLHVNTREAGEGRAGDEAHGNGFISRLVLFHAKKLRNLSKTIERSYHPTLGRGGRGRFKRNRRFFARAQLPQRPTALAPPARSVRTRPASVLPPPSTPPAPSRTGPRTPAPLRRTSSL